MRSADILHIGATVTLPMEDGTVRNCEVTGIDDSGFTVRFYTPEGLGPFVCVLPHGVFPEKTIHRQMYKDERGGAGSYWKWNGDFTGDYAEDSYIRKQIKKPND